MEKKELENIVTRLYKSGSSPRQWSEEQRQAVKISIKFPSLTLDIEKILDIHVPSVQEALKVTEKRFS